VIAVDSNILVHAHWFDSPWHAQASECIASLAESRAPWFIPWPCIHEFLAVVTHHRVFNPPSSMDKALAQVELWLESPSLTLRSESDHHLETLRRLLQAGKITGPATHDARVAAICIDHGVRELWSADRDFSRFKDLRVVNPLVDRS